MISKLHQGVSPLRYSLAILYTFSAWLICCMEAMMKATECQYNITLHHHSLHSGHVLALLQVVLPYKVWLELLKLVHLTYKVVIFMQQIISYFPGFVPLGTQV